MAAAIRLYLDENLTPAIAEQLRLRGIDAVSVRDLDALAGLDPAGRTVTIRTPRQCGGAGTTAAGRLRIHPRTEGRRPGAGEPGARRRRRGSASRGRRVPHGARTPARSGNPPCSPARADRPAPARGARWRRRCSWPRRCHRPGRGPRCRLRVAHVPTPCPKRASRAAARSDGG